MTTDLEQLVVQMSADIRKFEKSFDRAIAKTKETENRVDKSMQKIEQATERGFLRSSATAIKSLALIGSAVAGGEIVQGFIQLSDQATKMTNTLKVAGLQGDALQSVYRQLSDAAKANGAPVEALVTLYGAAARQQKELGVSSAQLIAFSSNVGLALRVAGTDSQEASGALLQLGQALGSGTVHAEEFNSVLEGVPTIAQAAAAGLKEANGSVAQLKQLVTNGEVSSRTFFDAFQAGSSMLQQQAAGSVMTTSQALENLRTQLLDAVNDFNNATGAAAGLAREIDQLSGGVGNVRDFFSQSAAAVQPFIDKVNEAKATFENYMRSIGNSQVFADLNKALGLTADNGQLLNPDVSEAQQKIATLTEEARKLQVLVSENTRLGLDNSGAMAALAQVSGEIANIQNRLAATPATVTVLNKGASADTNVADHGFHSQKSTGIVQVSVKDHPPTGSRSSKGGGGSSRQSDYERETQSITERTVALRAETDAQASVNPLVEDYGFAVERARTASDLFTAAQRSGIEAGKELTSVQQLLSGNFDGLSPKAREQATAMLALADAQAQASAKAEELRASQDRIRQSFEDVKSMGKEAVSSFVSDLRNGKSAADALSTALDKITDKLIDLALNSAFDSIFSSIGGGGGFLSFLGIGKKDGGLVKAASGGLISGPGGPRSDSIPTMLSDGEYVVNAAATAKNRALLEAINSGRMIARANGGIVARMASGGGVRKPAGDFGGNVSVIINNNSQARVSQKTRQTANGPAIDVLIDDIVSAKLATPGSSSRGAISSQFGLKSGLARR